MLIRILGEGQYVVPDAELDEINRLDSALEAALNTAVDDVRPALDALLEKVRSVGVRPPEDSLEESERDPAVRGLLRGGHPRDAQRGRPDPGLTRA